MNASSNAPSDAPSIAPSNAPSIVVAHDADSEAHGKRPGRGMWCLWATYHAMGCPGCGLVLKINAAQVRDGVLHPQPAAGGHGCWCGFSEPLRLENWPSNHP